MKNIIDPKNPHTVGKSAWNLGNHILMICFVLAILFVIKASYAEDSFENTMKKIDQLEGKKVAVEYDKIQPLKNQYCFIKVNIKEINGEIVKEEVVECADGRKAYDGPSYWELFAQFYYGDMNTPAYCRYYERPNHAYHKPGKVCLDKYGNWEVRK
tara:strand:+ start:348 stop:815 length:468 start_codon:yes stop_codon:yes gene_type:complete